MYKINVIEYLNLKDSFFGRKIELWNSFKKKLYLD